MAVNKVQKADGTVLIDLSNDTVTSNTLAEGLTAHNSSGQKITGNLTIIKKVNSITNIQLPTDNYSPDIMLLGGHIVSTGYEENYLQLQLKDKDGTSISSTINIATVGASYHEDSGIRKIHYLSDDRVLILYRIKTSSGYSTYYIRCIIYDTGVLKQSSTLTLGTAQTDGTNKVEAFIINSLDGSYYRWVEVTTVLSTEAKTIRSNYISLNWTSTSISTGSNSVTLATSNINSDVVIPLFGTTYSSFIFFKNNSGVDRVYFSPSSNSTLRNYVVSDIVDENYTDYFICRTIVDGYSFYINCPLGYDPTGKFIIARIQIDCDRYSDNPYKNVSTTIKLTRWTLSSVSTHFEFDDSTSSIRFNNTLEQPIDSILDGLKLNPILSYKNDILIIKKDDSNATIVNPNWEGSSNIYTAPLYEYTDDRRPNYISGYSDIFNNVFVNYSS